jgi:quercetin dioxygenase-like cupin family protein
MRLISVAAAAAAIVAIAVASGTTRLASGQSGFTRTVLQQVDLSIPGKEAITARVEFQAPNASPGRHTHPGEEIAYVIEGAVTIEIDGATKAAKAGEAFIIPAGRPHNATNAGARSVLLITYVVDKGKPLATPVK